MKRELRNSQETQPCMCKTEHKCFQSAIFSVFRTPRTKRIEMFWWLKKHVEHGKKSAMSTKSQQTELP